MSEAASLIFLFFLSLWLGWNRQKWKMQCRFLEEKLNFAKRAQENLEETFKALSHDALKANSASFFGMAKETLEKLQERAKHDLEKKQESFEGLVKPVKESLTKLDEGLNKLEKERKGDHVSLKTHLQALLEAKERLTKETGNLVQALRTPAARGRWGEIQLRRVVEIAGMVNQCDFYEQQSQDDRRPDLIVKLPGGRQVIVDAKVPLEAYLDGIQATQDEVREAKFKDHARFVRTHIGALSKKSYFEHFSPTPEFVVLFLPSETFFSTALQHDPSLIEVGAEKGVIIATPTTLIALLKAVAYGWKQESLSEHAEKVSQLGHELYKRIVDMAGHLTRMGRSLSSAVESYNKGIGSLESRVLVTARKFKEMGAAPTTVDLETAPLIDKITREISSSLQEDQP